MNKLAEYFLHSFDNQREGASGRKLTAFALTVFIGWLHAKHVTADNALYFLITDVVGLLMIFGLIKADDLIKLKNGNPPQS